jgi:hypothetical protein
MANRKTLKTFTSSRAARRRVWGSVVVLAVMTVFGFNASTAQQPPEIDSAFSCGQSGEVGGIASGIALFRVNINLSDFPNAICNDGSGAVFYVRRYSNEADHNKWHIHLQGGGGCQDGQSCAERWCSFDTNFGAQQMSTVFEPLPAGIGGSGIFSLDASKSDFAGWNHVLVYYCSSDSWSGTARDVQLSAKGPDGNTVQYRIHFEGMRILEAVIKTLQRQPGRPVQYRNALGGTIVMPDLDEATHVLFTGSSAGAIGVMHHADRLRDLLQRDNTHCTQPGNCPLAFRAVMDSGYTADFSGLDFSNTTLCQNPPFLCDYTMFTQDQWNRVFKNTWFSRSDESCEAWHTANQPGTEWMCADLIHVTHHHITTPYFVRQDLQDLLIGGNFVEAGFGTFDDFGQAVHDQLMNLVNLDSFAEEGSAMSGGPPLTTPGTFGSQCLQHVTITTDKHFFDVEVMVGGISYTPHDVLWNWLRGQQPQNVVNPYAGPGPVPTCP